MKKSTMKTILSYLNGETITNLDEIKNEIETELNRGAEKAMANRALYDAAREVVINGLKTAGAPVAISELYDLIKDELPDGFSRSKVQYGMTNYWTDEIENMGGSGRALYKIREKA